MIKAVIPVEDCTSRLISPHFGRANYYMVYSIEDGEIKENECMESPKYMNRRPGEYFADMGINLVLIPSGGGIGRRAVYALRTKGIKVYVVDATTADEAIKKFVGGEAIEYTGEGCPGKNSI